MQQRLTKYSIHFNKQKQCWSVHNRKICYLVDHVEFCKVYEMKTEEKPTKKNNPRFFLTCLGTFHEILPSIIDGSTNQTMTIFGKI